jgi:hypothetical protein
MQMFNAEYLQEKWAPILDYSGMDQIKDAHRRSVTAILLENQERELREERDFLYESPTNSVMLLVLPVDLVAALKDLMLDLQLVSTPF